MMKFTRFPDIHLYIDIFNNNNNNNIKHVFANMISKKWLMYKERL